MTKRGGRFGRTAGQAARTPFVLLMVVLLGGGLISLLLLNSALSQGSFQLTKLKKETTALTDEQQALQRDVDGYSAPDSLQRRAQEMGLVPGGSPVFIGPDGKITGTAAAAPEPPPPSAPPVSSASVNPPGPSGPSASPGPGAPSGAGVTATPAPAQNAQGSAPADAPRGGRATPSGTPQPSQTPGR